METAILGGLVSGIVQLLQDEFKLSRSVRADILALTEELELMRAALQAMDDVPPEQLSESHKFWAREVRQLANSVQNVIDNILLRTEGGSDPPDSCIGHLMEMIKSLIQGLKNRREFAKQIMDIKQRVIHAHARRDRYKIGDITRGSAMGLDPRVTPFLHKLNLVGMDEASEDLVRILTKEGYTFSPNEHKIVSIVGFGGVGKTSLALKVFLWLKEHLKYSNAFVTVGQNPEPMHVLRMMLLDFAKNTIDEDSLKDPACGLRDFLQGKRFIALVDDIWDSKIWDSIKIALESSNEGIVLVTTRRVDIAKYIGRVYRLPPLSEKYSRTLLYRRLFGSEQACPSELADKYEKFIKMCCGIPLAIIAWSNFLSNMELQAVQDPFHYDRVGHVRKILALSYTDLPPHLKSCLLYFSMFPRGYKISVERIVRGWIAEGFIEEFRPKTFQEIGENYLYELTNRCLIEPDLVDANGKILFCHVHDLIHDLITSLSTERNFSTILNGNGAESVSLPINRLSIHENETEGKYSMQQVNFCHVRSLVVCGDANLMPSLSYFEQLRVLDLGSCDALQNDQLKGIDRSPLLRFVVIGGNSITRLPNEMVKLKLLQILDLRESGLSELPEIIVRLSKLKHLYVNSHMKIPDGIGNMNALQELGDINISKPELLKELSKLQMLSSLGIAIWSWNESLMSFDGAIVEYLSSLAQGNIKCLSILTNCSLDFMEKLDIEWAVGLQKLEIMYGAFHSLPSRWIHSLHNLSMLSIQVYKLLQQLITMLGKLPNLYSLSLKTMHAPEGNIVIGTDGFQKLTGFNFASNAMGVIFAPGAMKNLERLKLSFQASRTEDVCKGFKFGLQHLNSLEHVCVEINCFNTTYLVVERAEAAIRDEISWHQILEIQRVREEGMIKEQEQERVTAFLERRNQMRD